jgi:hypothetical protein
MVKVKAKISIDNFAMKYLNSGGKRLEIAEQDRKV